MPLNKSTTYHQSVQFFVQFFSKKIVFLLSKNFFLKKIFKIFFTQFYLKSTQFYHILLSFTSSGTQFYQIPPVTYQDQCQLSPTAPSDWLQDRASIPSRAGYEARWGANYTWGSGLPFDWFDSDQ